MVEYNTRIQYLKGVGEERAKAFAKLGIFSVGSLLRYYPRTYEDWQTTCKIANAEINKTVCIKAFVINPVTEARVKGNMLLSKTVIGDGTGCISLVYFNNKYIKNTLKENEEYLFYGKVTLDKNGAKTMLSPRTEKCEKQRLRPVYSSTSKLKSKAVEGLTELALKEIKGNIPEILPEYLIKRYKLPYLEEALSLIHFPKNSDDIKKAKRRLIFEELLILQLGLFIKRTSSEEEKNIPIEHDFSESFYNLLPFTPTNAQKRAVAEAIADLKSEKPMNRLLQGDVGSGKTAVAAALIFTVVKNGGQSALMAPTEVLATQHYKTLTAFFKEKIRVELLTGSTPAKKKKEIYGLLKSGECDVVVGTHAIIQQNVEFKSLSLVITDEQHRFGVAQRVALSSKGKQPNVLVMSATPIPRTLAMIIYGDLDISVIDELPRGRQPVKTYRVTSSYHERLYAFLKKTVDGGHQCYIVCPLIEEGEASGDLVPATEYYDYLKSNYFRDYTMGLLHGGMKPKEKEDVMSRFYSGEIKILVSTVVIEVGVDVPNATVMIIENAERFGLSQLHQLRGRIGRGSEESTCVLLSDAQNSEARERFDILCKSSDGFLIAQKDLELRGPGDFFGERQHGLPDMHIANLMNDTKILYEAQRVAKEITEKDPKLINPENRRLKNEIERLFSGTEI